VCLSLLVDFTLTIETRSINQEVISCVLSCHGVKTFLQVAYFHQSKLPNDQVTIKKSIVLHFSVFNALENGGHCSSLHASTVSFPSH
jgi:hypothetical protein